MLRTAVGLGDFFNIKEMKKKYSRDQEFEISIGICILGSP